MLGDLLMFSSYALQPLMMVGEGDLKEVVKRLTLELELKKENTGYS